MDHQPEQQPTAGGDAAAGGEEGDTRNVADARYAFDEEKLANLRKESPWTSDPKYFTSVAVSPSAIMKMVRF